MSSPAKATGTGTLPVTGERTPTPPPSIQGTPGIGTASSSIASWGPVKTVRNSTVWSWVTLPFSLVGSFLGSIWTRISNKIWGKPKPISDTVMIEVPGWLWGKSVKQEATERAIRHGWLTIEQGLKQGNFTLEQATVKGWREVTVNVPGKIWGSTPTKMILKTAIQNRYITVEEAINRKYITKEQAVQADWIKK